ncbi:MAG: helix-turn-helix transcriptional regulator [Alphaproteobacteria bacterium]
MPPDYQKRVPAEAAVIGRNLRRLREGADLTQKDLARLLGISFQQVQKYERGENRLPVDRLFALRKIFGAPYHAFFAGLGGDTPSQELPWTEKIHAHLLEADDPALQDKIARVVAIMLE